MTMSQQVDGDAASSLPQSLPQSLPPALPVVADPTFSYASPDDPRLKRMLIRLIETFTGQPRLKRMYLDNRANPIQGETFFAAAIRYLRLHVDFDMARLHEIPKDGPLVIVANHPFGVIDGLVISHLASMVRGEFKVLTNAVLTQAPEIEDYLLPVNFDETREALATNIATRKISRDLLNAGGTIVIFPGGTVSTSPRPFGRAVDPLWQPFTAQLVQRSRATVVPMFFEGQNGRLFQVASHFSRTLRLSLLFREVHERIGSRIAVRIGRPIRYEELAHLKDRVAFADELRKRTYALGAHPLPSRVYSGKTWGEKMKAGRLSKKRAR